MNAAKLTILLIHALVGSALCAVTLSIGLAMLPFAEALLIHILLSPIFFIFISRFYFQKFSYSTPLQTAFVFLVVAMFMDFVLAGTITHRLDLFANFLATWIPFVLIFTATHLTGLLGAIKLRRSAPVR